MMSTQESKGRATRLVLAVCLILTVSSTYAQLGRINGGLEFGIPLSQNFRQQANPGFGVSVKYEDAIPAVRNLNWTVGLGYVGFGGKDDVVGRNTSFGIIPIQGGVKYYANERYAGFYGSAEIGINVFQVNNSRLGDYYTYNNTDYLSIAPGIGYQYNNFDFSGRLQLTTNTSYLSLRAAYVFDLNKLR